MLTLLSKISLFSNILDTAMYCDPSSRKTLRLGPEVELSWCWSRPADDLNDPDFRVFQLIFRSNQMTCLESRARNASNSGGNIFQPSNHIQPHPTVPQPGSTVCLAPQCCVLRRLYQCPGPSQTVAEDSWIG